MPILFDGEVHVHYGQVYVECGEESPADPMGAAFPGQANGLCGAALPGYLFLITGLHTGNVAFTVECHDSAPAVDDSWEEVVEVPFAVSDRPVALVQWAGEASWPLDLPAGDLRVRYSALGMDLGRAKDTRLQGEPALERYLLQFWPAPPLPDQVLKQTSGTASYWHDWARSLSPPPPPPTPAERAEMDRRAQLEQEAAGRRFEVELVWAGVAPSERLRTAGANVYRLVRLDRPLVDAIAEADPGVQRAIARWAARRACEEAGLASLEWVAPALRAVDHGDQLPPPFDDSARVMELLFGRNLVLRAEVSLRADDRAPPRIMPQAAALPSLQNALHPDPLKAALDALADAAATFADRCPELFRELRRTFPTVG